MPINMKNDDIKKLALNLLRADAEEDVMRILKEAGLWDDRSLWRLYGDKEGNFAQAGNQQSLPEAALVEKVVNCCDSRLMRECLLREIDPESEKAPASMRQAVATFFEDRATGADEMGSLANWGRAKRTKESHNITIAATGDRPTRGHRRRRMCLTIADMGEGQSPDRLPQTILSLNAKNKQRVRFVQGKFNMGGSGALRFCGTLGLQLVISRRDPKLKGKDPSGDLWGVTVVRRESPSSKSGEPVHSEFTYLAPVGVGSTVGPREGGVLCFDADELPLMPQHDEPYARRVAWGTAIKLYEYETNVGQSNVLMKDGVLFALERLLPEIALPVRVHECRGYEGVKERSFETALSGLVVRLEEGKGDNLEPGFPLSATIRVGGMEMIARIYAFKEDKAATYLSDEGVIFTIGGQAHGYLPKSIFTRPKAVGLPRLRDSLLVLVDCSSLEVTQREDLFMTSRDRLSKKPIRSHVEKAIEYMLKHNATLRRLQQERKANDVESKLSDEKPLEEVLAKVLKASPALKTLFLEGQRLARPFPRGSGEEDGDRDGAKDAGRQFKGRKHPTFFRHADVEYGKVFDRNCEKGRRARVKFLTDVESDYFDRSSDRGRFDIAVIDSSRGVSEPDFNLTLEDGEAHLNLALPDELEVGDSVTLEATVNDKTLTDPFVNVLTLNVMKKQDRKPGKTSLKKRRKRGGGGDQDAQRGIALPKAIPVKEGDKHWVKHKFTPDTACHVESDPVEVDGELQNEHTFYINVDNVVLKTEQKHSKQDARLLEAKFKYANVLMGVAMLHADSGSNGGEEDERPSETVQEQIRRVAQAVAPVLLPMIDQLAGLNEEDLEVMSLVGEDA